MFENSTKMILLLVTTGVAASGVFAAQKVQQAPHPAPAPRQSGLQRRPATQAVSVVIHDGLLTVSAHDCSVAAILDEISRQARVAIVRISDAGAETKSSLDFQNTPLSDALLSLLKEYDAFFFYGADKNRPAQLKAVWVYAKGKGRGYAPVPPEQWAGVKEAEAELNDPDPNVRSRAYEALLTRRIGRSAEILRKALDSERDEQVRADAMFYAIHSGVKLDPGTLTRLATSDPSPGVKILALDALQGDANWRAVAEQDLNDPDLHVQNRAREILAELDASARKAEQTRRSGPQDAAQRPSQTPAPDAPLKK